VLRKNRGAKRVLCSTLGYAGGSIECHSGMIADMIGCSGTWLRAVARGARGMERVVARSARSAAAGQASAILINKLGSPNFASVNFHSSFPIPCR
jgi:hypothetical protein